MGVNTRRVMNLIQNTRSLIHKRIHFKVTCLTYFAYFGVEKVLCIHTPGVELQLL